MACLYKRGNIFWISYRINGKLVQRSLETDCRRTAKEKALPIEYKFLRGQPQQTSRILLQDFLEEYCRTSPLATAYRS